VNKDEKITVMPLAGDCRLVVSREISVMKGMEGHGYIYRVSGGGIHMHGYVFSHGGLVVMGR